MKANSTFLSDQKDSPKSEDSKDKNSQDVPSSPLAIHLDEFEEEEDMVQRKAQLPQQMTGTKHMNILADLEIEKDEAVEEARRKELLAFGVETRFRR